MATPGAPQPSPARLLRIFADARTDRLDLSRPCDDDGAAMFRIHGDPATYRYSPASADADQATSERVLRA